MGSFAPPRHRARSFYSDRRRWSPAASRTMRKRRTSTRSGSQHQPHAWSSTRGFADAGWPLTPSCTTPGAVGRAGAGRTAPAREGPGRPSSAAPLALGRSATIGWADDDRQQSPASVTGSITSHDSASALAATYESARCYHSGAVDRLDADTVVTPIAIATGLDHAQYRKATAPPASWSSLKGERQRRVGSDRRGGGARLDAVQGGDGQVSAAR